ncbi:MAG: hypothetical protein ACI9G5_002626 [Paracoccaceae bacterium]|jgi:hypothetical protein
MPIGGKPANSMNIKTLAVRQSYTCTFSIGTLVTDSSQYEAFLQSCVKMGFEGPECEFLKIDNTQDNVLDAFTGINRILSESRGQYIILCHQDVELLGSRGELEAQLQQLDKIAPDWALAGNAGGDERKLHIRISDPHGLEQKVGDCPAKVFSLDENFIVVKAASRIAASGDLIGFHLYGLDLCVVADVLGYSAWTIDYSVYHKSGGSVGAKQSSEKLDFYTSRERLLAKYSRAFRLRRVRTTCTHVTLPEALAKTMFGRLTLAIEKAAYKLTANKNDK